MILLLPLHLVVSYIAGTYAAIAILVLLASWPTDGSQEIYPSIKIAFTWSGILGTVLYVAFAYLWRYVWRAVPKLNAWIFPDLNGKWDMVIEWNREGGSGVANGSAIIRQDFLKISMEVHAGASDSETPLAQPRRRPESGTALLYYIFRVTPNRTAGRSRLPYDGTAVLKVSPGDPIRLEGNYYTSDSSYGHYRLANQREE